MHLLLLCVCFQEPPQKSLVIMPMKDARHVEIQLRLTPELIQTLRKTNDPTEFDFASRTLKISVASSKKKHGPAIFARYRMTKTHFVLTPKYPLLPSIKYVATAQVGNKTISLEYDVPKQPVERQPSVTQIFPSGSVLPANCLKFYVHFSKPMRGGRAIFEQIEIRDRKGRVVHDPWRRTELWSKDNKRLTLWIHPGRIKQGVNLRDEFGPVLEPDQEYRLVITTRVKDLEGVTLPIAFEKKFRTTAEDRQRPAPQKWLLSKPTTGTREPLKIRFNEPLDHALLSRMISVYRGNSQLLGEISVGKNESSWRFLPNQAWRAGQHEIRVAGQLEDLAGNTPIRVFDTDLQAPQLKSPQLAIPIVFTTKQSPK
jgi:hypothetical protein